MLRLGTPLTEEAINNTKLGSSNSMSKTLVNSNNDNMVYFHLSATKMKRLNRHDNEPPPGTLEECSQIMDTMQVYPLPTDHPYYNQLPTAMKDGIATMEQLLTYGAQHLLKLIFFRHHLNPQASKESNLIDAERFLQDAELSFIGKGTFYITMSRASYYYKKTVKRPPLVFKQRVSQSNFQVFPLPDDTAIDSVLQPSFRYVPTTLLICLTNC